MEINNATTTVNATAKNLFYSKIPFGSEYVIFSESSTGYNTYDYIMYLKKPFAEEYEAYEITRQDNIYQIAQKRSFAAEELFVQNPYYAYSNIKDLGVREVLPVHTELITFSCLLLASVVIMKTMFGGLFKWSKK